MKDQDLGMISPVKFENKLIIAIDGRWNNYFDTSQPSFQSFIKNGKYVLVGPNVKTRPTKQNTTEPTGDVSNNE